MQEESCVVGLSNNTPTYCIFTHQGQKSMAEKRAMFGEMKISQGAAGGNSTDSRRGGENKGVFDLIVCVCLCIHLI